MAGHSKWNNIKQRKGAQDAKRGKIFSQISKNIRMAVREGGSDDPKVNASLRPWLDKAKAANMPKDNIQKALDRGMGRSSSGAQIQELNYEAFAPGGIGMIIVAMTDNTQRTGANVRSILTRAGGSLGGPGSAMYLFQRNDEGDFEPTMPMELTDEKQIEQLEDLADTLRNDEDVEDVYLAATWPTDEE